VSPFRWRPILGLAAFLAIVPAVRAQQVQPTQKAPPDQKAPPTQKAPPVQKAPAVQRNPHIGYVYPAGGRRGDTFLVTVGGQYLDGANNVHVSGAGVKASVVENVKSISPKEATLLRDRLKELLDKKSAATQEAPAPGAPDASPPSPKPAWTADDEAMVAEIKKKLATFIRNPSSPAIAETVTVQVVLAADAEPGHRELRLETPAGLTNPLVFCVGQLPEFSKKPTGTSAVPTKSVPKAEMAVTLPAVVNGQIMAGGVDRYRFQALKGQRLVVAVSARELVPYLPDAVPGWFQATLTLYDAKGNELAYDDDFRFNPDPVLSCRIPEDGEYAIEIQDAIYRGREDFVYRIALGELPFVTGIFPLGGQAGTQTTVEVQGWNLPATRLTMDAGDKGPGVYPLSVRGAEWASNAVPFAVDTLPEGPEREPNNQLAGAQPITLPLIVNGRIDGPGDRDVFRFEGLGGEDIVAEVYARRLNSPLDSMLKLTDAAGKVLASNDDYEDKGSGLNTHHADSRLCARLPADGTYYLHLADVQRQGGEEYAYRLCVRPPRPDFELRVVPASIRVRGSTSTPLTVYALRRDGFSGEIALELKDAPAGFALSGGKVPADEDQVQLALTVRPTSPKGILRLGLEGRATIQGREVLRPAVPAEDMMQAFAYRHLVPAQELMVAVSSAGAQPGGAAQGRSASMEPAAALVAKYLAKEVGLATDKTEGFVSAYVGERKAGLARLRTSSSGGVAEKAGTVLAENAKAILAVLNASLTPEQVRKAAEILGSLSGDMDKEVAFLLDAKVPEGKVEQALPVLSKYATSARERVYDKVLSGQLAREDAPAGIKELRASTAKELAAVIGEDLARKWAEAPAARFGGGEGGKAK